MNYLSYQVHQAGLSNQLMSLELGAGLAYLTNRILVPEVSRLVIPRGQTVIPSRVQPTILDLFDVPDPIPTSTCLLFISNTSW